MSPIRGRDRQQRLRTAGLVVAAALGAAAGAVASEVALARRAFACTCGPPSWQVELREVTSSSPDVGTDHRRAWPATANLVSYRGGRRVIHIWADMAEPQQIATAEATE
jgi:hypothetical protein